MPTGSFAKIETDPEVWQESCFQFRQRRPLDRRLRLVCFLAASSFVVFVPVFVFETLAAVGREYVGWMTKVAASVRNHKYLP